jgi:AraC-like DNA-binding protein
MNYKTYAPPFNLKDLVQCYWNLESVESETMPKDYFLTADSCAEIIFQYNEGFENFAAQSARVRFQHSVHSQFNVAKKVGFFGVRLYPHAVNLLLGMPATDVVNEVFDFASLFKIDGEELADQIFHAKTTNSRLDLISNFLARKASSTRADPIKCFVDQIVSSDGHAEISLMQRRSGLSIKQFERRFKAVAGFAPKYFARIVRFQSVKRRYASIQPKTMSSLAYANNYYDQSHFNREFKEFAGVQPLQYFKLMRPGNETIDSAVNIAVSHDFEGYLPCGWFV